MKRILISMSLVIILTLIVVFFSSSVLACSCVKERFNKKIDLASHIFVARIVSVAENAASNDYLGRVVARYELVRTIKGTPMETHKLYSAYGGGDCGVPFLVGRYLLVLTDETAHIHYCSGTRQIHPAYEDDKAFLNSIDEHIKETTSDRQANPPRLGGLIVVS